MKMRNPALRPAISIRVAALAVAFSFLPLTSAPSRAEDLHFAEDRPFDITHIKLDLYIEIDAEFVRSRARINGKALRHLDAIRFDAVNFKQVTVKTRHADDIATDAEFTNDDKHITVQLARPLEIGDTLDIFIDYTVEKPEAGLHFYAPSSEEPDAPYLVWSQGQSIDNRYWVPCFDHPNERMTTEISCTVARPYDVISNGVLVEKQDNPDETRTFRWLQDKPHVSYLMTLVVGKFASSSDEWRGVPLTYLASPQYADKLAGSFKNTPKMIEFFSKKIGVDYPWRKYAQICCYGFGGGMENTSATTLGESALVDERARLDDDPDGLISHELAHQWYGDLLTCRDWAHIWLNEGFASYFEALWDEEHAGEEEFAYNMRQKAGGAIWGGAEHPVVWRGWSNPDEQFDSRAYPKGAWVLHMIRRRLGDEMFWKVMKTYTEKYAYQCVETTDFRKTIEDVTGYAFERFFYDWTERPGSPEVTVSYEWIADDSHAHITIEQTQEADPFYFPLKLVFRFDENVAEKVVTHDVNERKCEFNVSLPRKPVALRIDPDQAVLMTLQRKQPKKFWIAQLSDENPSARLDAVDHFAKEGSDASIRRLAKRLSQDSFWAVKKRIAEKLGEEADDVARDALLASIDSKDARARAVIVEQLSHFPGDAEVAGALEKIVKSGDPSYRTEAAAIEAYAAIHEDDEDAMALVASTLTRKSDRDIIRSAALEALGKYGDDSSFKAIRKWASPKKSMECRAAAIRALGKLVSRDRLSHQQIKETINLIDAALDLKPRRMQSAAITAAGDCGESALPLLDKIEKLAKKGHRRIRRTARETAEKLRKIEPKEDPITHHIRQLIDAITHAAAPAADQTDDHAGEKKE